MASSKKSKPKKQAKRIGVALSGGLDSVVLLDAVCKSYPKDVIYALHVHHGLQAKADAWLLFCEQLAKRYKINFDFRLLHLNTKSNIEAQARQARYEALDAMCAQHQLEHLLLAHHQNDQAETVLLQLLRGAGVAGLAAMPAHKKQIITNQTSKQPSKQTTKQAKPQHTIQIWRPLLEQNRKQLEAYAKRQRLNWIEDPSNQDTRYRRNAIRKKILPELEQMQEGAITNLARSAQPTIISRSQHSKHLKQVTQRVRTISCAIGLSNSNLVCPPTNAYKHGGVT
jgi:tRNA(Ile)-lysidine synthase